MSAGTLKISDALIVPVPVDRIEIINGPGAVAIMGVMDKLKPSLSNPQVVNYEEVTFTMTTAASNTPFIRKVKIACIFDVVEADLTFTGIFCGKIISGLYNTKTRKGWFNLD